MLRLTVPRVSPTIPDMLRFAAATFEIFPKSALSSGTLWSQPLVGVFAPLKSSLFLIEEESNLIAILTSNFITDYNHVSLLLRKFIGEELGVPLSQVFCFSSHNHSATQLNAKVHRTFTTPNPDDLTPEEELTDDGMELLRLSVDHARALRDHLEPSEVRYGIGQERRITHNRKGRRADGSTYLMREEDRLLLGEDFNGDIDDDAFVVGFFKEDRALGFLTQFTGHPVTAFHCDSPLVCAEYPQVACDDLSRKFGNVPVGFLQGCAGDVNAKGLLSDLPAEKSVLRAEGYGHQLGETFLKIAENLRKSERTGLKWLWSSVRLPYKEVPQAAELELRIQGVKAFLSRCENGEEPGTRVCDGLNFSRSMDVSSRANLVQPTMDWLKWALAFHEENRLEEAPKSLGIDIAVIRIGDVGIVGLPGEPFLGIGRKIKTDTPLPFTIPCGYMNEGQDSFAYIPDGPNCEDLDYCSSFYRYTLHMLPFRPPAGDALAEAAVQMLKKILP